MTDDKILERVNHFLDKHIFKVPVAPTYNKEYNIKTNVKVKLTGTKNYIVTGDETPHIQYTLYILESNPTSDMLNGMIAHVGGSDVQISTSDHLYYNIRMPMNQLLTEFLTYFGLNERVICTRVVNEVKPKKLFEGLIIEGQLDKTTRILVKDIISIFKYQREGEWELPEDLSGDKMVYDLPGFEGFNISLDLQLDDNMDGVDVDGDLYFDDDLVVITIISNPNAGYSILDELTKELSEVVRHELEHIRQYHSGTKSKNREIKNPEKYYTQKDEIEAQIAGFRKRAKMERKDFETIVRNWFKKNKHKHRLNPKAMERVIEKLLQSK